MASQARTKVMFGNRKCHSEDGFWKGRSLLSSVVHISISCLVFLASPPLSLRHSCQHWGHQRRTSLCMSSRLEDNFSRICTTHLAFSFVAPRIQEKKKKEQVYHGQQSSMTIRNLALGLFRLTIPEYRQNHR